MPQANPQKFYAGQRVKLLAFDPDGQVEEFGVVEEWCGIDLYTVRVDHRFRGVRDDGLREVTDDQLEAAHAP